MPPKSSNEFPTWEDYLLYLDSNKYAENLTSNNIPNTSNNNTTRKFIKRITTTRNANKNLINAKFRNLGELGDPGEPGQIDTIIPSLFFYYIIDGTLFILSPKDQNDYLNLYFDITSKKELEQAKRKAQLRKTSRRGMPKQGNHNPTPLIDEAITRNNITYIPSKIITETHSRSAGLTPDKFIYEGKYEIFKFDHYNTLDKLYAL